MCALGDTLFTPKRFTRTDGTGNKYPTTQDNTQQHTLMKEQVECSGIREEKAGITTYRWAIMEGCMEEAVLVLNLGS